jgi:hypothetical protein
VLKEAVLGQVFSEYFGFPFSLIHSTDGTTIITIYHPGLVP